MAPELQPREGANVAARPPRRRLLRVELEVGEELGEAVEMIVSSRREGLRPGRGGVRARTQRDVLSQVAGHKLAIVKALPPLTITEDDLVFFVDALDATIRKAQRLPRSLAGFALTAAGVR